MSANDFTPAEPEFQQWLRSTLKSRANCESLKRELRHIQFEKQKQMEEERKAREMHNLMKFWKRNDER